MTKIQRSQLLEYLRRHKREQRALRDALQQRINSLEYALRDVVEAFDGDQIVTEERIDAWRDCLPGRRK